MALLTGQGGEGLTDRDGFPQRGNRRPPLSALAVVLAVVLAVALVLAFVRVQRLFSCFLKKPLSRVPRLSELTRAVVTRARRRGRVRIT